MTLDDLFKIPPGKRDEAWERQFLGEFAKAPLKVVKPEPVQGPDGWPYLLTATGTADAPADDSVANVARWLATRGIGLAVNAEKTTPDYVFSYGMVWNFAERGEFLAAASGGKPQTGKIEITNGQELLVGPPSEAYLPGYVRKILRQFLADQNVFAAKVLMVSTDRTHYDLCFSLESLRSPPESEHAGLAEAIAWFLPAHYSVALLSEKTVSGFQPL